MRSCNLPELETLLQGWGEPGYRARQLFRWLQSGADYPDMRNLPAALRQRLAEHKPVGALTELTRQISRDGTEKALWQARDGETFESVRMTYDYGKTACISTQAGCRQGCAFCASAVGGLRRNLTAGEMLSQVLGLAPGISRVVLMGIGEPLDNFENVCRFLENISHKDSLGLSLRHISLSTCGLREGIDALAEKGYPVTLSVSLHAPDDETRTRLMPVNRQTPVAELLAACGRFFRRTGRRVSYEYLLIDGVNDSPRQAELLVALLRGQNAHLNLIPMNPAGRGDFRPSPPRAVRAFQAILEGGGLNCTVRRTLGQDIAAACGQLRRISST
jgi:23S rRNA (adenine2503-C2)-methyltransferase